MLKEMPGELNKKLKRMQTSRDNLKDNVRERAQQNKKLLDRNVEIIESRDMWKSRCQKLERELKCKVEELKQQIEIVNQVNEVANEVREAANKAEEERRRAEKERERADLLQAELEGFKKKSRS